MVQVLTFQFLSHGEVSGGRGRTGAAAGGHWGLLCGAVDALALPVAGRVCGGGTCPVTD